MAILLELVSFCILIDGNHISKRETALRPWQKLKNREKKEKTGKNPAQFTHVMGTGQDFSSKRKFSYDFLLVLD